MGLVGKLTGQIQTVYGQLVGDRRLVALGAQKERRADAELKRAKRRSLRRTRLKSRVEGARAAGARPRRRAALEARLRRLRRP
jgi:hypothetical protein